jgi:outer membrane murein-binding lipoprotein Lpp
MKTTTLFAALAAAAMLAGCATMNQGSADGSGSSTDQLRAQTLQTMQKSETPLNGAGGRGG